MKHLRKFNESRAILDTNNLGDILQEITDMGYLSHVESSWWSDSGIDGRSNGIEITIYGKDEWDKNFGCDVSYIYPDEIMETVDRIFDYLNSEGYEPEGTTITTMDIIKNRPTEKRLNKKSSEINIVTSRTSQVTMRWDDKINGYKVHSSLTLYFNQK